MYDNADDIGLWMTTLALGKPADGEKPTHKFCERSQRLADHLPRHKRGCIIFTTRNKKATLKLAPAGKGTLPAIDEEAANQLLIVSLDDASLVNGSQDVSRLLAALTNLPLAITQAATYINANIITVFGYLALLEEKEEDVVSILSENFEDY